MDIPVPAGRGGDHRAGPGVLRRAWSFGTTAAAAIVAVVTFPVALVLAFVEWLLTDLVARVLALPFITWDALGRHRRLARIRGELRSSTAIGRQQAQVTADLAKAPFAALLGVVDDFDRRQAALDPHFAGSLQASRAICDAAIAYTPAISNDPVIQRHLHDALTRALAVFD